jgi:hypothetical protein
MKSKRIEFDVDFIGGQSGLTSQEEKALSEYFAKKKITTKRRIKSRTTKRPKATT